MVLAAGISVTTLAKSYVAEGKQVHIITGNHTDQFDKVPGVTYRVVPFRSEDSSLPVLEGACDFNYLMFTTHTESTANFWDASLEQIHSYIAIFQKSIATEYKTLSRLLFMDNIIGFLLVLLQLLIYLLYLLFMVQI